MYLTSQLLQDFKPVKKAPPKKIAASPAPKPAAAAAPARYLTRLPCSHAKPSKITHLSERPPHTRAKCPHTPRVWMWNISWTFNYDSDDFMGDLMKSQGDKMRHVTECVQATVCLARAPGHWPYCVALSTMCACTQIVDRVRVSHSYFYYTSKPECAIPDDY